MNPILVITVVSAVLWAAGAPAVAQSKLYKWVDDKGYIHYSNTPISKDAQGVDDALPPASSFVSPTPPSPPPQQDDATTPPTDAAKAPTEGQPPPADGQPPVPEGQSPPPGQETTQQQAPPAGESPAAPPEDTSFVIPKDGPLASKYPESPADSSGTPSQ